MALKHFIVEFFENSTIHGLVHISTANNKALRATWVMIVIACFAFAISMITNSYNDWQDSPVSTTITTHPIEKLEFPSVTVCPPRGSNTALNQVLAKVKDVNFTKELRQMLITKASEVFLLDQTKRQAESLAHLLSPDNIRSIANKQASITEIDKDRNMITMKSKESEGIFSTPGFDNCNKDFFRQPLSLHYVIEFPKKLEDLVGDAKLMVSVQTNDQWNFSWNSKMQLYSEFLNWSEAEDFCISHGKHLASVTSKEEQLEVEKVLKGQIGFVWIGGKWNTEQKSWQWIEGEEFNPDKVVEDAGTDDKCLTTNYRSSWIAKSCSQTRVFICQDMTNTVKGSKVFSRRKESILDVWWKFDRIKQGDQCPGIQITWKVENGSVVDRREFVSKELSGTVLTPGLGSIHNENSGHEQEYTVVLDPLHNNTKALDDADLVVDIDVTIVSPEDMVQLHSSEFSLVGDPSFMSRLDSSTKKEAGFNCMLNGGFPASIKSSSDWQYAQKVFAKERPFSLFNNNNNNNWATESFVLGGSYIRDKGEWMWFDGSRFSFSNWAPGQPDNTTGKDCLVTNKNGTWNQISCQSQCSGWKVLCLSPRIVNVASDTQLIFTARNISKPAIQLKWKSQLNSHSQESIGGIKLTWQLKKHIESFKEERDIDTSNNDDDWKLKKMVDSVNRDWLLVGFVNLAQELKGKNIEEAVAWKTLLKYKGTGKEACFSCIGNGCDRGAYALLFQIGQELLRVCIGLRLVHFRGRAPDWRLRSS